MQPERIYNKAEISEIITLSTDTKDFAQIENNKDPNLLKNFKVKILDGDDKNQFFEVWSNGVNYKIGDKVFVEKYSDEYNPYSYYLLNEKIRYLEIFFSIFLFFFVVVILFGKKGLKAILSLFSSFIIIFFVLLPLTLKGYNPVLVASFVSVLLLGAIMYITNGYNRVTASAFLGCLFAILITIILSFFAIEFSSITGKFDENSVYVNFYNNTYINFSLIIIASMIIGVIGAVDDGAVTQSSVVKELKQLNPNLSKLEYYKSAMRVGQDHAGAMINTLVLAYTATSLPLIMSLYLSPIPLYIAINQEIIATEIFRATIGSIGLLLAIPLTTLISVYLIKESPKSKQETNDDHNIHHFHRH